MTKTLLILLFTISGTGGELNLTLGDAIKIALENNRDIQIQEQNVVVSEGEIKKQEGVFDPLFNLVSLYNDGETPQLSTFIPSGTIKQKQFSLQTNVEGDLPTGTFYNLFDIQTTRTDTNSPIEDLSPNWFNNVN